MIRHLAVLIIGSGIAIAQQQKGDKGATSKPDTTVSAIPAGAAEVSPGLFKHTDRDGKTWMYRKTPFGVVKSAQDSAAAAPAAEPTRVAPGNPFGESKGIAESKPASNAAPSVTAVEDGDSYKFERSTPFGPAKWKRKKTELTADEQEIVQRLKKTTPATTGSKE